MKPHDRTVTIKRRLAQRPDLPSEDAGSAAPNVPSSFAAIDRVKERTASLDQAELMAMIDNEVEAVRAARSRRNPPTAEWHPTGLVPSPSLPSNPYGAELPPRTQDERACSSTERKKLCRASSAN